MAPIYKDRDAVINKIASW